MARTCLFCDVPLSKGAKGNSSEEHVIAQNLLQTLRIEEVDFPHSSHESSLSGWTGLQLTPLDCTRSWPYNNFIYGRVCKTCNNGWMSRIEQKFTPLFRALAHDERGLRDLGIEDREILARWALKTACVLTAATSPPAHGVPRSDARQLYSGAFVPKAFAVTAAILNDGNDGFRFSFCSTAALTRDSSIDRFQREVSSFYRVFMQLTNVMFLVTRFPAEDCELIFNPTASDVLYVDAIGNRSVSEPASSNRYVDFVMSPILRLLWLPAGMLS